MMVLSLLSCSANAGMPNFYTDRATWESDVAAVGLTIATEEVAVAPLNYSSIVIGGVDFFVSARPGTYDALNERIGYTSGGGRTLGLDHVGGLSSLFGFGLDKGPTIGLMRTTELDGDFGSGSAEIDEMFLGVLGTVALEETNSSLPGAAEYFTSGLGARVYFDNLSVAVDVRVILLPPALHCLKGMPSIKRSDA